MMDDAGGAWGDHVIHTSFIRKIDGCVKASIQDSDLRSDPGETTIYPIHGS